MDTKNATKIMEEFWNSVDQVWDVLDEDIKDAYIKLADVILEGSRDPRRIKTVFNTLIVVFSLSSSFQEGLRKMLKGKKNISNEVICFLVLLACIAKMYKECGKHGSVMYF